ncbi:MAG TPA: hypothetical protein VGH72_27480, partial [Pseudonocardia sp.]
MRWQRLGEAARTLARRRSARLTAAGVAVLVVLALTWVVAVASISTVSTAGGPTGSAWLPTAPAVAADSSAGSPGSSAGSSDTAAGPSAESKRIAPPGPGDPGLPVDVSGAARDRSVVRNARLELSVGDVVAVSGRLRSVAAGVGGFVASEQSVGRSASFT